MKSVKPVPQITQFDVETVLIASGHPVEINLSRAASVLGAAIPKSSDNAQSRISFQLSARPLRWWWLSAGGKLSSLHFTRTMNILPFFNEVVDMLKKHSLVPPETTYIMVISNVTATFQCMFSIDLDTLRSLDFGGEFTLQNLDEGVDVVTLKSIHSDVVGSVVARGSGDIQFQNCLLFKSPMNLLSFVYPFLLRCAN